MSYDNLGVVITTHGYSGIYIKQCIECYMRYFPNSFICLFVNESQDKVVLNIEKEYPSIKYIYVTDQKAYGGLTGTWNKGIDMCFDHGCEVVILSNDDIFFDNSIYNIVNTAYKCSNQLKYFGPLTNNPGPSVANVKNQKAKLPRNKPGYVCKYKGAKFNINGFFMVFPKKSLIENKFDEEHYFDPKYPFGGNEKEWFDRFIKKGGVPVITPRTFIYHYKLKKWRKKTVPNDTCIFTINLGGYDSEDIALKKQDGIDCLYFTDNPLIVKGSPFHRCLNANIVPLYVNPNDYEFTSKLWKKCKSLQRYIKACPHLFLPHNYKKSLYIDANITLKIPIKNKLINRWLSKCDLLVLEHPNKVDRSNCVKGEAVVVVKRKLETADNVNAVFRKIIRDKFPDNIGLSETCFLVRNHNKLRNFGKEWYENIQICIRDQISFDYMLWKYRVRFMRIQKKRVLTKLGHVKQKNRYLQKNPQYDVSACVT